MEKTAPVWEKDGFVLWLSRPEEALPYYRQNLNPLDPETTRLTGSPERFEEDAAVRFFLACISDPDRYDFLLHEPDGRILGEAVLNEIDWDVRSANFRIAIFHPEDRGKGTGSWMIRTVRDFAFETLKLRRLSLDVFSFNPRAEQAYLRAGFRREGVLRGAVRDGDGYADDILMAILEPEWRALRESRYTDMGLPLA